MVPADRMLIAWKGSGNDNLNVATVQGTSVLGIDGVEGVEGVVTLPATTDAAPALASHGERVFLAWKGSGNDQLNLAYSDDDGASFSGTTTLTDASEYGPSLALHGDGLFVSWAGVGNGKLNVAKVILLGNTAGGAGVEVDKVVLGDSTEAGPALASYDGRLFLAWKGAGNDNLNLAYSEDNGATFIGKTTLAETSSHGPSLASHADGLFLGWKGSGNESLNVAKVILLGNTAGGAGFELAGKVVLDETSTESLALGSQGGLLFVAWKGQGGDNLNFRVSRDGTFQAPGPWLFSDLTRLGFFVAAYRTPPAQPFALDPPLDNVALVYAMEAGGMDFNTFKELTVARNSGLPAKLEYGGLYEFHAPDDKHFSISFRLSGDKYQARIRDLNDPNSVSDLSTLPLVSGEYLNAPGVHDGHFEIRHPGCESSPVVLDFRNVERPVRDDNKAGCPGPWIDRVQALFAIDQQFGVRGRTRDAQTALVDAVHLYDELGRSNPGVFGPLLAPVVIQALGRTGADFSVPEADLRDWLADPVYTPYPAIAEALLLLVSAPRLKAPVFLDVIVWNYEQTPGVASPRNVADVKPDVLKAAIVAGWNIRYGTHVTDFEELL